MVLPPSPPPSAATVASAWRQFRALLRWSALTGVLAAGAAVGWMWTRGTAPGLHLMLAMGGGIFLALLLGGALMGLVFVSSRLGHDEEAASGFEVDDRF